jgi:hypothetical protein
MPIQVAERPSPQSYKLRSFQACKMKESDKSAELSDHNPGQYIEMRHCH